MGLLGSWCHGRAAPIDGSLPSKRRNKAIAPYGPAVPALAGTTAESKRQALTVYPPHPEEGATACVSGKRNRCVAPVSKDGRPPISGLPEIGIKCAQVR